MAAMIEIKHLCKNFADIAAVVDVSFTVARGEVLGFLGPNGAGKSTTMKIISGFLAADSGAITIDGEDIAQRPVAAKRRIGYLPEGAPLYADMTPAKLLEFVGEIRGFRGSELRRRIEETVAKVNLGAVMHQPIDTLSKGFKRRVGIAQAILHDPEILILDEPTDGLDPNQKHEVRALIREMAPAKVTILSTHILEEVDAVCTRAVIIAAGRIIVDGTPAELEARAPHHNAVTLALQHTNGVDVAATLRELDGVARVEQDGAAGDRFVVVPEAGLSIIDAVSATVRDRGWRVAEMHVERGRLDDVFRAVTRDLQKAN